MPKEHEHSAYRFHQDLFLSGLERIILVRPFYSLSQTSNLHALSRSRVKRQRHTTQPCTLSSRATSHMPAVQGMSSLTPWHASSACLRGTTRSPTCPRSAVRPYLPLCAIHPRASPSLPTAARQATRPRCRRRARSSRSNSTRLRPGTRTKYLTTPNENEPPGRCARCFVCGGCTRASWTTTNDTNQFTYEHTYSPHARLYIIAFPCTSSTTPDCISRLPNLVPLPPKLIDYRSSVALATWSCMAWYNTCTHIPNPQRFRVVGWP